MAGLVRGALGFFVLGGVIAAGCGGPSDPPESPVSQAAANEEAAKWTPEQKDKFREAMKGHALTTKGMSADAQDKNGDSKK